MAEPVDYDLIIVGGGMVGASLAIALADTPLRIALLEAVPFRSQGQPSYDDRAIALAYGTRRIFAGMGLWPALAQDVTPIANIHISDRGHFGATHLDSRDSGAEALGYVVESRALGAVIAERLQCVGNVSVHCPATVTHVALGSECAAVTEKLDETEQRITCRLNIAVQRWEYGQTAIITNVTPDRPHGNRAFERFTDSGPLALLPMSDQRYSVVWTVRDVAVQAITSLDDSSFLQTLQQRAGHRAGRFVKVGRRRAYPLALVRAREHVRPRLALIGNAAHTLHPVAGQGFNLGLRDVAVLADVLCAAIAAHQDIGDMSVLRRYAEWRQRDRLKMIAFTDGLARLIADPLWPLRSLLNMSIFAVDLLPPVIHLHTQQTRGLAGKLPRLARGLPLDAAHEHTKPLCRGDRRRRHGRRPARRGAGRQQSAHRRAGGRGAAGRAR